MAIVLRQQPDMIAGFDLDRPREAVGRVTPTVDRYARARAVLVNQVVKRLGRLRGEAANVLR
jgi:hypothetical protein